MLSAVIDRGRLMMREARVIRYAFLSSVTVLALHLALVAWFILPRLGLPLFALHYTVYFGVDAAGPAWRLLDGPALGALILLANVAVTPYAYVRSRWAGIFLALLTLGLQLLLAVSTFLIILMNL